MQYHVVLIKKNVENSYKRDCGMRRHHNVVLQQIFDD